MRREGTLYFVLVLLSNAGGHSGGRKGEAGCKELRNVQSKEWDGRVSIGKGLYLCACDLSSNVSS